MEPPSATEEISADEIALYDRQIRLWGVKAQEKALAGEIVKNLVLAGVGSVTIADTKTVREEDLGAQFFLSEQHIGLNRAEAAAPQIKEMNPRVNVKTIIEDVRSKGPEFFAAFNIVIGTDLDFNSMTNINAACRVANRPSYVAGTHGFYGFIFSDLISHDFVIERQKSNVRNQSMMETKTRRILSVTEKKGNDNKIMEVVTKREEYHPLLLANTSPLPEGFTQTVRRRKQVSPLLTCLRALWEYERSHDGGYPNFSRESLESFTQLANERHLELRLDPETLTSEFLRSFIQNLGSEISPVAAFLGGSLAQDVINVLSAREQPLQNFLVFDGEKSIAPIYPLHPFFPPVTGSNVDAIVVE
ncbi:hypothetical protein KEM54_000836 [Ascosphaera aggregata]|nr:hypothetical protein KEM54_000836 [Ascosphaera aggregata]